MRLIRPSYEIITPINGSHGEEILKNIELASRVCYKSEDKIEYKEVPYTDGVHHVVIGKYLEEATSARKLIKNVLMAKNHEAMLEFGGMITVKFTCDRGVSHELVRHRMASHAQESTRFCNYNNDKFGNQITFIIPNWIDLDEFEGEMPSNFNEESEDVQIWLASMSTAEIEYNRLIKLGWKPQQARSILPNSLKTEINVSANIREWRHIFKLRTSNAAHPQMQELMRPLLKEFQTNIPILFDDITY